MNIKWTFFQLIFIIILALILRGNLLIKSAIMNVTGHYNRHQLLSTYQSDFNNTRYGYNAGSGAELAFLDESYQLDPCYYLDQARLNYVNGDLNATMKSLKWAADCPDKGSFYEMLGNVAYIKGNLVGAISEWYSAPDGFSQLVKKSKVFLDFNEVEKAGYILNYLIKMDKIDKSNETKYYETLGLYGRIINDPSLIMFAYTNYIQNVAERSDLLIWMGIAQRELGEIKGSEISLRRARNLIDRENCNLYIWASVQLGLTLETSGEIEKSVLLLRETKNSTNNHENCTDDRAQWFEYHLQRLNDLISRPY